MPGPADLFAQIQARQKGNNDSGDSRGSAIANALGRKTSAREVPKEAAQDTSISLQQASLHFGDKPFLFDEEIESFLFAAHNQTSSVSFLHLSSPCLVRDKEGNADTDILVPLAPCAYRMTDYTFSKKEPVALQRCVLKLGVMRCLYRECQELNKLLRQRFLPSTSGVGPPLVHDEEKQNQQVSGKSCSMEEAELGKVRFMELLSNCGVYQKVSELILQRCAQVTDHLRNKARSEDIGSLCNIPQVRVDGLEEFLQEIEYRCPSLAQSRSDIDQTQSVSFYPGLGELFSPGSKLICFPEGMEGTPLGCQVVQCWYDEELNKATQTFKRRFILVIEFIVSVGDELVFVAASDVYPEFHDPSRNQPIKDLTHRKLLPDTSSEDRKLLHRMQQRGEFYASVATKNHYLEYHPNSFFPIIGGGWSNNAIRPLTKGGRVMVDVKRGILEGHLPVRGTSDGMSDTVKEAIKLFEQSKRTGVAVPFRTCILPGFDGFEWKEQGDRHHLWQAWPMLTGFSFTARVWGKLLLGMPKQRNESPSVMLPSSNPDSGESSPRRPHMAKWGVSVGALGGVGSCGNCGYISFQQQAFEQLVLAEDKKELIRAVARNAGGGPKFEGGEDLEEDDDDALGIDVVANKGGASIFLLHGPPGCGKTLTAEAIAELLRKPLYVVTAGDLGITAAEVEKTLGAVLELCQTWDALVLIDEADVFLEARSSHEIQRNALVCVMLRLLEYYSGCLFLSSNRSAGSIDPAIASRITVMLSYPPLDIDGRAKVWRNLIELVPLPPVDTSNGVIPLGISDNARMAPKFRETFSTADYQKLASTYELNGRQIKNSIVLARALARERGALLSLPILCRAVTAVVGENAVTSEIVLFDK